jgi:hypothetical protein
VLGLLLRRYDLRATPGYQLRVQESLTLKPEGFTVTVHPRQVQAPAAVTFPAPS